jgi:hypothetical protein
MAHSAIVAIRKGHTSGGKGGPIYKDKSPIRFRIEIGAYFVVATLFLLFGLLLLGFGLHLVLQFVRNTPNR